MKRNENSMQRSDSTRLACVLVGLPARGKTFISQKVCRYLQWMGISTRVFNVGNYRRKIAGARQPHQFFDPGNSAATELRKQAAAEALRDMLEWLCASTPASEEASSLASDYISDSIARVAIYDATNSTRDRRQSLKLECERSGVSIMFIESICTDPSVVLENIREVKLSSPDYLDTDPEEAAVDFMARIKHYEDAYEPLDGNRHLTDDFSKSGLVAGAVEDQLDESQYSYVKLINVGKQVIINQIHGCYLQTRVVYYLMNLHITPRSILMSRHGESMFNVAGKIGGDADLSPRGQQFAKALPNIIRANIPEDQQLTVWTSTLKRTIQTSQHLPYPKLNWKALDEIDAGVCDGMTYEEIEDKFPEDFAERDKDKYNYRYRGGESYKDLVLRLEPIIMELERQQNILIVAHQAVLRAIYAYFLNLPQDQLPYVHVPLHTVIKLTPKAYGTDEETFSLPIEAVDTHRAKPSHGQRSSYGEKDALRIIAQATGSRHHNFLTVDSSPEKDVASGRSHESLPSSPIKSSSGKPPVHESTSVDSVVIRGSKDYADDLLVRHQRKRSAFSDKTGVLPVRPHADASTSISDVESTEEDKDEGGV